VTSNSLKRSRTRSHYDFNGRNIRIIPDISGLPAILFRLLRGSQVNVLIPSTQIVFSAQGFDKHSFISAREKKHSSVQFSGEKQALQGLN